LIVGFNTFLPPGYNLELTNNPEDPVKVTTPNDMSPAYNPVRIPPSNTQPLPPIVNNARPNRDVSDQYTQDQASAAAQQPYNAAVSGASNIISNMSQSDRRSDVPIMPLNSRQQRGPIEFNHAINYVNKIKTRFANQPETYRYFLEILQTYQKEDKPIQEVS
jgi:paired amphipathic helix protein Sin3a